MHALLAATLVLLRLTGASRAEAGASVYYGEELKPRSRASFSYESPSTVILTRKPLGVGELKQFHAYRQLAAGDEDHLVDFEIWEADPRSAGTYLLRYRQEVLVPALERQHDINVSGSWRVYPGYFVGFTLRTRTAPFANDFEHNGSVVYIQPSNVTGIDGNLVARPTSASEVVYSVGATVAQDAAPSSASTVATRPRLRCAKRTSSTTHTTGNGGVGDSGAASPPTTLDLHTVNTTFGHPPLHTQQPSDVAPILSASPPQSLWPIGDTGIEVTTAGTHQIEDKNRQNITNGIATNNGPPEQQTNRSNIGDTCTVGRSGQLDPAGTPGLTETKSPTGPQGQHGDQSSDREREPCSARGSRGPKGKEGMTGLTGANKGIGPWGEAGLPGLHGKPGTTVMSGPKGRAGKQGPNGNQGAKGATGWGEAPGTAGPWGSPGAHWGATGPIGSRGNPWETWRQGGSGAGSNNGGRGATGAQGSQGHIGPKGQAGAKGQKGDVGLSGARGDEGPHGPTGATGSLGEPGEPGEPGSTGSQGLPGPDGSSGPEGDPGDPVGDVDECAVQNGGCMGLCINVAYGFYCTCPEGYISADDTKMCSASASLHCTEMAQGRLCFCRDSSGQVTPLNGTTCTDVDECALSNGGCEQKCQNVVGSYECSCLPGFKAVSKYLCEDVNECSVLNGGCSAGCINTQGGYYCTCPATTHLLPSRIRAYAYEVASSDMCDNYPLALPTGGHGNGDTCQYHGQLTLIQGTGGCYASDIRCRYDHHYQLTCNCLVTTGSVVTIVPLNGSACVGTNECLTNNAGCAQTCVDDTAGFHCTCATGYTLSSNGRNCEDVDECNDRTLMDQHCKPPDICINTPGSYECWDAFAISKSAHIPLPGANQDSLWHWNAINTVTAIYSVFATAVFVALLLITYFQCGHSNDPHHVDFRHTDPVGTGK